MRVIFNADDFGLHPRLSDGILESIRNGVVRSCSVLATCAGAEDISKLGELKPLGASFGVHLSLTVGKPLSEFPADYLSADGSFTRSTMFSPSGIPRLPKDVVRKELSAQVDSLLSLGPAHLDSHHHVHSYFQVLDVVIEIARKLNLPVRAVNSDMRSALANAGVKSSDLFIDEFFGKNRITEANLASLLMKAMDEGARCVEVMCHPGYVDGVFPGLTSYLAEREIELRVLTGPSLREKLEVNRISLISYESL